ncbi:MAG: UvrB/UvrC motif-containing protein [Planctomycetota bacterium]
MICEICREEVATVHLTEIVNNAKKEIHLCETCAQEKGVAITSQVKNLSIPEFFGQLVESSTQGGEGAQLECGACGMTYQQFRATGKLGCPGDYRVFRKEMDQLLRKIHDSVQHRGKVPSRVNSEISRRKEIEDLKISLKQAVEREEYEMAAQLRDRIFELEQEEHCS